VRCSRFLPLLLSPPLYANQPTCVSAILEAIKRSTVKGRQYMSEESGHSDQEKTPEQVPKWGDPISPERQAELQQRLDQWRGETDHGERKGPFDGGPDERGMLLTGADVCWLADQSGRNEVGRVPDLHLEEANLNLAHLEGANLSEAHLEDAYLREAHLETLYSQPLR
jgi:hypothetical protein